MQLHEAGVNPEEAGKAPSPGSPLLTTQVILYSIALRMGFLTSPVVLSAATPQLDGWYASLGVPYASGLTPSTHVFCRVWAWPRLWHPY